MTAHRRQAFVEAPVDVVWELVGNPRRHPEWWPRVLEVRGEQFDEGSNYAQVTRNPVGSRFESVMHIDRLEDMRAIEMSCNATGTMAHWLLTEAEGGTFVDVELGMNPKGPAARAFDTVIGRAYFRRWVDSSVEGLRSATTRVAPRGSTADSA